MKSKAVKKIIFNEEGISEILADIMILMMTVVLFGVIFAFVYSLPAPDESTYADFETNVDLYEPSGVRINVTHIGGEDLYDSYTDIYIFLNAETSGQVVKRLTTQGTDPDNPTGYGIDGDKTWSPGETWTYYYSGVTASDDLEVKIVDTKFQSLVMATKILGAGVNDAPIVMERWYNPNPAYNASVLKIYAKVMDPDGYDDINASGSVYANVSALNKTYKYVNFDLISFSEKSGTFKGEFVIDRGQGTYTLSITAKDSYGHVDRGRMVINVAYTALNVPKILERWSIPEVGVNGSDITVYARVEDLDGYDNLDCVEIDIGPLDNSNGNPYIVNMTDPEKDGIFEYSTMTYVENGDLYQLNFTARDITALEHHAHLNVSIKKFNPIISRMWTIPTIGKDDESLTIFAEVTDPDGYNDISEVKVNLQTLNPKLGWEDMTDPEKDGIFEFELVVNVSYGGNKTVQFLARDKNGNDVMAEMKVFIATRHAPVILNRWTDPVFAVNNSNIRIFVQVIDADGYDDIDFVLVNISAINRTRNPSTAWIEMIDYSQDGNFLNISRVNQEAGTYMIEFLAQDRCGNQGYATMNITILAYRTRFLSVWTSPYIGKNGSFIHIFANVMDPNGYDDIETVKVDISQLNQSYIQSHWVNMTDYNKNGTFTYKTMINVSETGIYSLNFSVRDKEGNEARTNHQLLVTSNKPTIVLTWYSPSPAINGTNVTIYAWISDEDGYEDIASVMINVSTLNHNLTWINMTDSDKNGIFEVTTLINTVNISRVCEVPIFVFDSIGNSYNKTLEIEVVLDEGEVVEDMVFIGDVTPNSVDSFGDLMFTAIAKNGTTPGKMISEVKFTVSWKGGTYTMTRLFDWYFKYQDTLQAPGTTNSNLNVYVYFKAYNETGDIVAYYNITVLVLYDKSGGSVTSGTALEQNVAWISEEQGFVITNNKTSNEMIQIFDASNEAEYGKIWVKIGSNTITNTGKANIWQLRSRSTGEIVTQFSSPDYKFRYDGVMAGYWFFVLDINTTDIYSWMLNESSIPTQGDGSKSEYFDVYMKIKDTNDDFFATTSWIIVHGGTSGFIPEIILYYDLGYIPGENPGPDSNGDGFPDDLVRADGGTLDPYDDYTFDSIEIAYFRIIMDTYNDPPPLIDFVQFEMVDFKGNRRISNGEGMGPVGEVSRNMALNNDYMFAVDFLKADKDPWLVGSSAYSANLKGMSDADEEYAIIARNLYVRAPTSIMDVVSGRQRAGQGTNVPRYYGDFYENQGGAVWSIEMYAYYDGLTGQQDPYGSIFSVDFEDLDNDDDKDIVVVLHGGTETNPAVVMFDNDGSWTRTDILYSEATAVIFSAITVGDLDGDNDLDIATTNSDGYTYLIENKGAAEFSTTPEIVKTGNVYNDWDHAMAIEDLDGDFDPGPYVKWGDVVVATDDPVGLVRVSFSGSSWTKVAIDSTIGWTSVDLGDLEGDGDIDIVASTESGDIYLFTQEGEGSLNFIKSLIKDYAGTALAEVGFGDIDGTGNLDIVVARGSYLEAYTISGGLISDDSEFNQVALNGNIVSIEVGNVDGAIQDDIIIATDNGYVYNYRNLGKATEWLRFLVDDLGARLGDDPAFFSIAIGDADKGGA